MTVFNTFNDCKRYSSLPLTDILIWTTGLINLKRMGYKTKIFCLESDISFLMKYGLFDLYDEFDVDTFIDNEKLREIDHKHFWSTRKIEAISVSPGDIYSDTDIILRKPLDLSHDALLWSPEPRMSNDDIYVPWRNLSKPAGYKMPAHIRDTSDAYNCGIMWMRDHSVFEEYREEYYKFALGNPCKIRHAKTDDVGDLIDNNAVWACNAEQRILKAVLDYHDLDVGFVMNEKLKGWSREASHYFHYRVAWRYMNDPDYVVAPDALAMLNLTIKECLITIASYDKNLLRFWLSQEWLRDAGKIDAKAKSFPIKAYI